MADYQSFPANIKKWLTKWVSGFTLEKDTIGASTTVVYQLKSENNPSYFLKVNQGNLGSNLRLEGEILSWLEGKLPCPRFVSYRRYKTFEYLLITKIKGTASFICSNEEERRRTIKILVEGLNLIHSLDINNCPFDRTLNFELENAKCRMLQGFVNENNFDSPRLGRTAESLYDELLLKSPKTEDLVFTHGDYCLPNILINEGKLGGFIDWEKAGISDRYQDIALCLRSVIYNFGEEWGPIFLDELNFGSIDYQKIEFYQILDEFY